MTTAVFSVYSASGANGLSMSTEPAKRPSDFRRTWLDVLPEGGSEYPLDQLMTRQELVEKLRTNGIPVSETDIVFWEKRGVLPRAIRRHRDGAARALYPPRAYGAIAILRHLQKDGLSLDAVAPRVWQYATRTIPIGIAPSDKEIRERAWDPAFDPPEITDFDAARAAVAKEDQRGLSPGTIQSMEVRFFDGEGNVVATERFHTVGMLAETVRWAYKQD